MLDSRLRHEMIARGRELRAAITVAAHGLSDGVIAHVRTHLEHSALAKVRIRADSRAECEQAAAELAERVPCEVVNRVGRVVLLHRADPAGA